MFTRVFLILEALSIAALIHPIPISDDFEEIALIFSDAI